MITPTDAEWIQLYEAARLLYKAAPWRLMGEQDVFGVQDGESGNIGFVSVMGAGGEFFGVALYLGAEGLHKFLALRPGRELDLLDMFEIPHLKAFFEPALPEDELALLRRLNLRFKEAWPVFRSFRPGYTPWSLDAQEARFLKSALYQVIELARRDPARFKTHWLVRVQRGHEWIDERISVPAPKPMSVPFEIDELLLKRLHGLPKRSCHVNADFTTVGQGVQSDGPRPYCQYVLLMLEVETDTLLRSNLLIAAPSLEEMWASVPNLVGRTLLEAGFLPQYLEVRSALMFETLTPLVQRLGVEMRRLDALPGLYTAKAGLRKFLSGR